MRRRGAFALGLACAASPVCIASAADRPTAVLEFEGAPDVACVTEADFRSGVAERMGYDPFRDEAARRLSIRLGVGTGELTLSAADGSVLGRRTLHDEDCGALRDSLVLAATIGLDPLSLARPGPREATPAAPTPPSPPVRADARGLAPPPDAASTARPSRPVALRVALGAEFFAGLAPGDAIGPSASVGVRYGRLGLDLEGATTTPVASGSSQSGAEGTATVGSLLPCYRLLDDPLLGSDLCGVFTGGALFSRGVGVTKASSRTDPVWSLGMRATGDLRFSRALGLSLFLQGSLPLEHDELSVETGGAQEVVWKTPPASLAVGLEAFARIP